MIRDCKSSLRRKSEVRMQCTEAGTQMAHQAVIKVVVDVEATRATKDVVGLKVVGMRDEVAEAIQVLGEDIWATTFNLITI